jgi:hypothetical protein
VKYNYLFTIYIYEMERWRSGKIKKPVKDRLLVGGELSMREI